MFDLVIRGGDVIDGTGAPRTRADVAVKDGRVVAIGRIDGDAARVIDATGKIVAPGFIDVHTHYDAQAFWDGALTPSPLHGVTTVLGGNCGFSIAPLTGESADADYLMRMLARVEGMPLESLQEGVPWSWRTTAEYLDELEGRVGPNVGVMVGHSAMRRGGGGGGWRWAPMPTSAPPPPRRSRPCHACCATGWKRAGSGCRRRGRVPTTTRT